MVALGRPPEFRWRAIWLMLFATFSTSRRSPWSSVISDALTVGLR
jgi:hypothetical protein